MNPETSNPSTPTTAQLKEARLQRWHQTGEALLTVENLRSWINAAGMVLFAPRPQVVAPAPTFVEAVQGAPNPEPSLDAMSEARALLGRLVAEGVAVPLNLMGSGQGTPGDTPDFVVSASAFAYIFTLRGDKAWKQPPANTGPAKVSNLALATHEALTSKGALSAYDLATELGKEVTETACLRALNELWTQLRVLPLLQPDGSSTVWELTSARFLKQIKAGANAGQPTALSALISLYLGQAMIASEDEIESVLSPLAPRSRIREVTHALLAARELDTVVIDGKTLLHVAGEAPAFIAPAGEKENVEAEPGEAPAEAGEQTGEAGSRIQKFVGKPRKIGTGYLSKGKPAAGKRTFARDASGSRPGGSRPGGGREEKERRPFRKPAGEAPERRFDKPWTEDRPRRKPEGTGDSRPARSPRPTGDRPAFERRDARSGPRPPRRDGDRPQRAARTGEATGFRRDAGASRERGPARRPGAAPYKRDDRGPGERSPRSRENSAAAARPAFRRFDAPKGDRRPRPEGDRPPARPRSGGFDRGPRPGGDRPAARPRPGGFDRRPRAEGDRPAPRAGAGDFARRPPRRDGDFAPRPRRQEGASEGRPPRREGNFESRPARTDRSGPPFGKPKFGGGGPPRSKFSKSPAGKKPFAKKPYTKKPAGGSFKPKSGPGRGPRRDDSA